MTKEIESVDRDTGGIDEKAELDLILEKLSNVPASTNDNTVLTKLDKIQDQLTELQSQVKVDIEIENKQPNRSSASPTYATSADYTESTKIINMIRSLKELIDLGFKYDSNTSKLMCVIYHQSCDQ